VSYHSNLYTLRTKTRHLWHLQSSPILNTKFWLKYSYLLKYLHNVLYGFKIYLITLCLTNNLSIYLYIYYLKKAWCKNYLKFVLLYLSVTLKDLDFKFKFINIRKFLPRKLGYFTKFIFKKLRARYNERLRIKYIYIIRSLIFGIFFGNTRLIMSSIKQMLVNAPYKRQWGPIRHFKKILRLIYRRHKGISGIRLRIKGKISGRRRKMIHRWFLGNVATASLNIYLLYDFITCVTPYGSIGVKLWLVYTIDL